MTLVYIVNLRLCVLTGRSLHFRTSVRFAKRAYQFHPHLNSKISTSHLQISHHHLNPPQNLQNHFDTYFDKIPQIQQKSHIPTTQILTKFPHQTSLNHHKSNKIPISLQIFIYNKKKYTKTTCNSTHSNQTQTVQIQLKIL